MSKVIHMPDGYGGYIGERSQMSAKPGAHAAYAHGSNLVVEWYDFTDDAPYESANLLIFGRPAQQLLAAALDADVTLSPHLLSSMVAARLHSYFAVKDFATERGIGFESKVDFWP